MKSIAISGSRRENVGTKQAKELRKAGNVPCVLYGGKEPIHFQAPEPAFKNLVYTADVHTVDLDIDGAAHKAIMKEIQFHPVSDKILHIDFLELAENKPVVVDIPVKLTGNSVGVRAGGKLIKKLRKLSVKALPKHLPDVVEIAIDNMEIGHAIRVSDLKIEGAQILDSANNIVTAVQITRQVVEEPTAAAPAAAAAAPAAEAK